MNQLQFKKYLQLNIKFLIKSQLNTIITLEHAQSHKILILN